jgi:hypothetical protein
MIAQLEVGIRVSVVGIMARFQASCPRYCSSIPSRSRALSLPQNMQTATGANPAFL